jgi:uncharacterized membrane protein YvlD (DUF360 family)
MAINFGLLRWIVPSVVLVLVLKCPLYVAGFYTLLSDVGMSFTAAVVVRNLLIVISIGALTVAVIDSVRRRLLPALLRSKSRSASEF